jgi:hypothetical protein
LLLSGPALGGGTVSTMTEILYRDEDPGQGAYTSRLLVYGDRLRMDYGSDREGFTLFDRGLNRLWLVSSEDKRITEIPGQAASTQVWPEGWKVRIDRLGGGVNAPFQVRVNGQLCTEYRVAPILKAEASLLSEMRQGLSANQYASWSATPRELRQACTLAMDVKEAGIEYRDGLPLAIRYWDGRSRTYQGQRTLPLRKDLFELPAGYSRFVVDLAGQGNASNRQPPAAQAR